MSANLETLELTINGNAQSASQGIGTLIRSLTGLANAIGKPVGGLMKLNAELEKLKGYGRMKLPDVGKASGAAAVKSGAQRSKFIKEGAVLPEFAKNAKDGTFASWMYGPRPLPNVKAFDHAQGFIPDEQMKKLHPEWYVQPGSQQWKDNIANRNEALRSAGKASGAAAATEPVQQVQASTRAINENQAAVTAQAQAMTAQAKASETTVVASREVTSATDRSTNAVRTHTREVEEAGEQGSKFGQKMEAAFNKVGRMFSTMVTRMAIKALIKNFTEAWKAAYNFSKKVGGDFAKNIDKVRGSLGNMAMNLIRAFSPLMNVIAPIFSVIATGIKYLADAIASLVSMLGITSELLGATAEHIADVGKESNKSAKDVVAGFDELNVLNQSSGGSGSGNNSTFTTKFQEEIDSIKMIVAESLLAVGLILAFGGHVGIGIALAAAGAATIVGTLATKWGQLSNDVKSQLLTIMTIAGTAMLAVGLILAFTGVKLGLGIALIAAGAANLIAAVALSWNLDQTIKEKIGTILAIAGTSMLAIGLILALSGVAMPLGIALMAAGGISLVTAAALNWDALVSNVKRIFNDMCTSLVKIWEKVKKAISDAWEKVKQWANFAWTNIKAAWEGIKTGLINVWDNVKTAVSNAWLYVTYWASQAWNSLKSAWNSIRDGLVNAWNKVRNAVYNAWLYVSYWLKQTWANIKNAWESIKNGLVGVWESIKNAVYNAWLYITYWASQTWNGLKGAWEAIKNGLVGAWDTVKNAVKNAWDAVTNWLRTTWDAFGRVWVMIGEKLCGIWSDIKGWVSDTWNKVKEFWSTSIIGNIKKAWEAVGNWFYDHVTMPVANFFIDCVNGIISGINWLIRALNSMHFTIPGVKVFGVKLWDDITVGISGIAEIKLLERLQPRQNANGAYDIPAGQLFIANEAGAEMVGSLDGKTAVANQQQIIEGIRRGVGDANMETNRILLRQNELLAEILRKEGNARFGASSAFGKTVKQSLNMYNSMVGG